MTGESRLSETGRPMQRVVILGGGTAGWMTAAALVTRLPHACTVRLIESAEIGIVGVGEATLPHLRYFIESLGIDEAEFMRATHATFKLGIDFKDFGYVGSHYFHPFGRFGTDLNGIHFHHFWLWLRAQGKGGELGEYSLGTVMAAANRFAPPSADIKSVRSTYSYAYQFDATLFAPFMRDFATARGAIRTEGKVVDVERDAESGDVAALTMENGERVEADLFVDCSGFAGILIGRTLDEPWEDWSHWLPNDRAVAMPTESLPGPIQPFTGVTAMKAGWRWHIPLQHRVGNGYVYSSSHIGDQEAADALVAAVRGKPMADPRMLRFRAGRRSQSWVRNVVSIGLASGFLEPLESTSIYLTQAAIERLTELFPAGRIEDTHRAEYNRLVDLEYDRIRDFLILHYHATTREDSSFWNQVRTMSVPDSLKYKVELWLRTGRVVEYGQGLFFEPSWLAVLIGQGLVPQSWDQRVGALDPEALEKAVERLRARLAQAAAAMPEHQDYIASRSASIGKPA